MRYAKHALAAAAALALVGGPALGVAQAAVPTDSHSHNATGWTMLGKWKKGTRYHVGDVVTYRGKTYVATKANKVKPRGSKKWDVVSKNGTAGMVGPAGPTGATGPTGAAGPTGPVGPNWVLKDKNGTTLGTFAGAATDMRGLQTYSVLFQDGIWSYLYDGRYAWWGSLRPTSKIQWPPYFTTADCTGSMYMASEVAEELASLAAAAGGSFRLIFEGQVDLMGFLIPAGATMGTYDQQLYGWVAGDTPSDPRTCQPLATPPPYAVIPLTQTPMPPAAAGGLRVTTP